MNLSFTTITQICVLTPPRPSFKERLASTELRRGLYRLGWNRSLVAGELPGPAPETGELHFVLAAGRQASERYQISADDMVVTLAGESEQALLYAVFDFLERQGAYFGIDGDTYAPERSNTLHLPSAGQPWNGQPRFATRGLLPWPDFMNCITAYNREDWRAYLESMLRMRFNTLGVHVYAQRDKWAESFLSFEYGGTGHAAFLDTTATDRWGFLPQRTSRFGMGAAQYFDSEVFGADVGRMARDPWESAELAQALWGEAFAYAEQLGIRTGVGFEPYQLPDEIMRACPPNVRIERTHHIQGQEHRFKQIDPQSRTARYILETRLNQLLEAYPSVSHVYLWEDEFANWASQSGETELAATPFMQAHAFLARHAPGKRLVLAGWGGVARNFERFHRVLPEDVIFTCLSDQVGWDAVHPSFGALEGRERWPIPWIEDDPAMWFPQLHVNRFAQDLGRAEQYGCQGVLGIHWRHRIVDPVAGYLARRCWDARLAPVAHYRAYARSQAVGERAAILAQILERADTERRLLSTWNGKFQADGRHVNQGFSGDYNEAFMPELGFEVSREIVASQTRVIAALETLAASGESEAERERLGYWAGQVGFMGPYAEAWSIGTILMQQIATQYERKQAGEADEAAAVIHAQTVPLYIELLGHVRAAVLAFQHTVATRNDQGMLASIHNKLVRIATFRMREALLEFLDPLPPEVDQALAATLAPDLREAALFVPTRPTRLAPGEWVRITAIAPGIRELAMLTLRWRKIGASAWTPVPMQLIGRRTYAAELSMPVDAELGLEYIVDATFAGAPPLVLHAPPPGAEQTYVVTT